MVNNNAIILCQLELRPWKKSPFRSSKPSASPSWSVFVAQTNQFVLPALASLWRKSCRHRWTNARHDDSARLLDRPPYTAISFHRSGISTIGKPRKMGSRGTQPSVTSRKNESTARYSYLAVDAPGVMEVEFGSHAHGHRSAQRTVALSHQYLGIDVAR